MNSGPARSPARRDGAVGDRAARLLGWPGIALPGMTLLGCRVLPVVVLDPVAHAVRAESGDGPQLDGDTLAVWEWPESVGGAPASVVTVSGLLVPARGRCRRAWRSALTRARSLRGFAPAAILAVPEVVADEVCWLEHALHGIGLVPTDLDPSTPLVHAAPGRAPRARRRTADRWIEEQLYSAALAAGVLAADGAR